MGKINALSVLVCLLMPFASMAMDTSDCEQIGYLAGNDTKCTMYSDCMKNHADMPAACRDLPKTDAECADQIARQNAEMAKHDVLIKCPITDARRAHKFSPKDHNVIGGTFVTSDGMPVAIDDLVSDDAFVYYARMSAPMAVFITRNADAWHVFGPGNGDVVLGLVSE